MMEFARRIWTAVPGREIVLSLGLALFTGVIAVVPGLSESLQFDRSAVAGGEIWRLLTGHFCHWNVDHLFWDLSMFLVLGTILERDERPRMWLCLGLCFASIVPAIAIWMPEFQTYRGLSGIDSGLFILLMTLILKENWNSSKPILVGGAFLGMAGLAAKTLYEMKTGATLFVDHEAAGMIPIPLSHLAGGIAGLLAGMWPIREVELKTYFSKDNLLISAWNGRDAR
ncbi:MAG: rhombosortase [Planctomycetaceae bacterium]|nr:rhombosortase [Planctomycetaceae bacterium]